MSATPPASSIESTAPPTSAAPPAPADPAHGWISRAALILALAVVGGNLLLSSPPRGETYPGAIPWGSLSVLRPLTEVLSLGGVLSTVRGTEIKDLLLQGGAVVALLLLACRLLLLPLLASARFHWTRPCYAAQYLLWAWVAISALSVFWSADPALSLGQAALYGLALAWATALAWTLSPADARRLLIGLAVLGGVAGALCVWYYFERNPHHRPGFPVGNPATLSACMLPGLLLGLSYLGGAAYRLGRFGRLTDVRAPVRFALSRPLLWLGVSLVPLAACFSLAGSRAATLGLLVGVAVVVLLNAGRRARAILGVLALAVVGAASWWIASYSRFDVAMARSDTIRFRLYAWRYAAELWRESWLASVCGQGAGTYPALAGQLSIRDRVLDPAAFQAEMVEHAHNELFEILTEIGLIGGVTFLGGWLATLAAGAAAVRAARVLQERWLHIGLIAAIAALMMDSMFSPGLRLAAVPAVFYTLLGILWALSRATPAEHPAHAAMTTAETLRALGGRRRRAPVIAGAAVLLAVTMGAGILTGKNARAVVWEGAANEQLREGKPVAAAETFGRASGEILDPVRQLVTQAMALHARLSAAGQAFVAWEARAGSDAEETPATTRPETEAARQLALRRCQATYKAADALHNRAPTLFFTGLVAGSAAELLGHLEREFDPESAQQWYQRAGQAFRLQKLWRPYDVETLLALTHYPGPVWFHLGLLRDALRSPVGYDRWGQSLPFEVVRARWHDALANLAEEPGFDETLNEFLAVVGPLSQESDLDTLAASRAPEVYRLAAQAAALRGDLEKAEYLTAKAAALYEPLRARLKTLYSVTLLEQANLVLAGPPARAAEAVELLKRAIAELPVIQEQKYEEMSRPFRGRLADAYVTLAARQIRTQPPPRPQAEEWLAAALEQMPSHVLAWSWTAWLAAEKGDVGRVKALLEEAEAHGVAPEFVEQIRGSLCQEFPELCAALRAPAAP